MGHTRAVAHRDRDLDRADLSPPATSAPARQIDACRVRDHHDHTSHTGCVTESVTGSCSSPDRSSSTFSLPPSGPFPGPRWTLGRSEPAAAPTPRPTRPKGGELRDRRVRNYVAGRPLNLGNYMTADTLRSSPFTTYPSTPPTYAFGNFLAAALTTVAGACEHHLVVPTVHARRRRRWSVDIDGTQV